jgi:titin
VIGNYIGIDVTGTASLGNGEQGINIASGPMYNKIGGQSVGERNIISGNALRGVNIANSNYNTVLGNFIGTDVNGNRAIGNKADGILLGNANYNTISKNIISGNTVHGFDIMNSNNNSFTGNYIGVDVTGNDSLSNGGIGITIWGGSNNNIVGGSSINF